MATLVVQGAVGAVGAKASTEMSLSFAGLVDCGGFQYGLNGSGIHRLNTGNTDAGAAFTKTITLVTSDYGNQAMKRFRYIDFEIVTLSNIDMILGVRPNGGAWIEKTVTVSGGGLHTVRVSVDRENGQGNLHSVRLKSTGWFRLISMRGLINDRRTSIKRR